MTAAQLLARVPLFHALSRQHLDRLAAATREESHGPGEIVVEIGEPGHSLFLIVEGQVQVLFPGRSRDFELARLGPGDFFGEMAVLNDKPRSATVRAVEGCRVIVLSKEDLHEILLTTPDVAVQLLGELSGRLRATDEHIGDLSERATRDTLTGLLNRLAFTDRLAEECDRTRRYGDDFSVLLLDVDHFRSVNDTFGPEVGDRVLAWLGRMLEDHTRTADTPFRTGGEEFAVLCPRTGAGTAGAAALRLVGLLSDARPPLDFDLKVTVSAGYASCPVHGNAPEELYRLADRALLRAKSSGRNGVCAPDGGSIEEAAV
ncbi:MAG: GGDEF domain-containing protein [Gemmatimonadota bacterium]|jgi:diguanylate cyclase (GGDEF)-like protein